jgi:hypothetical protein
MAHYYNADEYVIFKSNYKRVKKLQNMRCWIECKEGPRYANPPRTDCDISLMFERTDNNLSELEGSFETYKAHLIVNGEDHLHEGTGYIAHEWGGGINNIESMFVVYLQQYDPSVNRTITVSAYIESDVYDFGRLDFTFDLPEIPKPATITVPSVIEAGTPFSVVVNPSLGFCNYSVAYRLLGNISDGNVAGWKSISNDYESKTLYISKDFTLDVDRHGESNFQKEFRGELETKTSVDLEFSCTTRDENYGYYNLGSFSETVKLVIPESVKPITNSLKCAPMNPSCLSSDSWDGGYYYDANNAKALGYVKGLCKARLFICFNSEEAYGLRTASSFKSYKVWAVNPDGTQTVIKNANFKTNPETTLNWPVLDIITEGPSCDEGYWWGPFYESSEFGIEVVTPILNNVGQTTYYATVTDRRGRTSNPVSVTINVVDYNKPVIARIRAQRCTSDGSYQEDGNNIICEYEASYPNVSGNSGSFNLKVYEGLNNSGTLVETKSLSRTNNVAKGSVILTNKPNHMDYYLELVAKDKNVTVTRGIVVHSTNALLDIAPNGGIAIGKLADSYYWNGSESLPMFEVNMAQKNYSHIIPSQDGVFDLGGGSNERWRTLYAVSCACCSDASFKENISYVVPSNKSKTGAEISQEDLHSFYKSDYQLATYNYIGQEQQEYGFITQDMYDNSVGETLIIRNENGDMFSINSYISTVAGALQYEINLRDEQIATLNQIILEMKQELENLKQGD